ncbi:MAG: UDP-N-acetylmuramoyl-L-alanine--D-glutamate ligase [Candidatus Eremiobacteraeota bacterium]|nr:UDP-N-acetylmuramoyl-L-alanine--D-glutamate ligase [Candidatus Eremiobacteraeota bacterium]
MPNDDAVKLAAGDRALIIGVGRSGMATAAVLRDRGLTVTAYDDQPRERLRAQHAVLAELGVELTDGSGLASAAKSTDVAVLSPGVPLNNPAVLELRRAGIPVISEIEAAYRIAQAPLIAVTGTKGKSTTTALIGHLLRRAGAKARTGGNIGNPLIREAAAAGRDEWLVAEVSSFQLEGINAFRPRIGVLLNISPDHLDRYPSMDEYREAKFRIFANQGSDDWFVGNEDDPGVVELRDGPHRRIPSGDAWFSVLGSERADVLRKGGWIVRRARSVREAGPFVPLIAVADLQIKGMHNVANAMAAYLAASLALLRGTEIGTSDDAFIDGLRTFAPLPHRLQTVADHGGVRFVDDSKASTPDAVLKALAVYDSPVILIAGGRSKRTDFSVMAKAARTRAKMVVLIGESARELGALLPAARVRYAQSMEEAVATAAAQARRGDVVLLSPGCASFDMFESAEARGDAFAAAVRGLNETANAT